VGRFCKDRNQFQIPFQIAFTFFLAYRRLPQKVHRKSKSLRADFFQSFQGTLWSLPQNKLPGERFDLLAGHHRRCFRGQGPGFNIKDPFKTTGDLLPQGVKIFLKEAHDGFAALEGGKDIDKAKKGDTERFILHGPLHQFANVIVRVQNGNFQAFHFFKNAFTHPLDARFERFLIHIRDFRLSFSGRFATHNDIMFLDDGNGKPTGQISMRWWLFSEREKGCLTHPLSGMNL